MRVWSVGCEVQVGGCLLQERVHGLHDGAVVVRLECLGLRVRWIGPCLEDLGLRVRWTGPYLEDTETEGPYLDMRKFRFRVEGPGFRL